MIVVDASAMVEMLMQTEIGLRVRTLVEQHGSSRHAPHLMDVEVMQVLRRFVRSGFATLDRAQQALEDLGTYPIRRHGHVSVLVRAFALRDNVSAYDAVYLALAEALDATLVTCDAALVKVPGGRARVELVAQGTATARQRGKRYRAVLVRIGRGQKSMPPMPPIPPMPPPPWSWS